MDIKAYIEIPIGSSVKYEVNEETGQLEVDRFLFTAFKYPFNYGYIVGTHGGDGDPLDVVVLSSEPVVPGVVIKCHPIGVLVTEDEEGSDNKVIAVPNKKVDPFYGVYENMADVPEALVSKIKHFYENYKTIEPGKWIKVRDFLGKAEAEKEIESATK